MLFFHRQILQGLKMATYKRWIAETLKEALNYSRVIILSGARQCGKTTLAQEISRPDSIYRTLDSQQILASCLADPEGFVSHGDELMIIDEVQRSPSLLQAVKKNVDENKNYGRFLLTGSANILSAPTAQESLAGRVTHIRLRPLSMGEIYHKDPDFVENAFNGKLYATMPDKHYCKDDYLRLALIGGYPEANALPPEKAPKWHLDYIKSLLDKDIKDIANIRKRSDLNRLLRVLAAWSTKEINVQSIGSEVSLQRQTIETYIDALESLYLIERVKAWPDTDYQGVRKKDKLIMCDTGLMSSILRWKFEQIQLDGDRNGKLIESFIYQQLAAITDAHQDDYDIWHYRDSARREIDFIIENSTGELLGIEVKAGSNITPKHFHALKWFKYNVAKDRNFKGIVLYSGNDILPYGDEMWAVPISLLWQ